jgi:hypothetical protein
MIKRGKIRVLPAVQEILPDRVRFAGGAQHPFEAIILATGYSSGLDELIKGFETIADARGRPNRFGEETGICGLYGPFAFVVFSQHITISHDRSEKCSMPSQMRVL